jgi:cytochrome c oxidase subunit 2
MSGEFQWMPEQASTIAGPVDRLYAFLWLVSGVMSIAIAFLIVYFAIKYRRGSPADRRELHTHFFWIEASWIVGPLIVVMVMFFWGARLFFVQMRPPVGAMEITGVGRQWMWKFQHPSGRSEINDLHVPLGRQIVVRLISEDVIHSLFIPAFRTKSDVLPGRYTTVWFEATRPGVYHLFCAEYCGTQHSGMGGRVYVMEERMYQEWLEEESGLSDNGHPADSLLVRLRCVSCHGAGTGENRAPPLTGLLGRTVSLRDGRTVTADENYIRESILRPQAKIVAGYPPIMPSYEGQLTEETINQLIRTIQSDSLESGPADAGAAP